MSVAVMDDKISGTKPLDHLALDMVLPWHEQAEQQEKFRRLVKRLLIPVFAFMVMMSILPSFLESEIEKEKVVAQVILEPPKVVETPPPPQEPVETKTQNVKKDVKPKEGVNSSLQNLAALSQQMNALRQSVNASTQQKKNIVTSNSGNVQKSSRSRLGKNTINSTSGGLKASDITVNAKGAVLQGHDSDEIESPILDIQLPDAAQYHYDPKKNSQRAMQDVRRVIERYKGAVNSLYAKVLRSSPDIGGRFTFKFTILPDGTINNLKISSSELNHPQLEQSILNKLQNMNFGPEDLQATDIEYTYSFTPS